MKTLLIDSIGCLSVTPEQINESMQQNNGKVILSGVMQRADATNQNGRQYPEDILRREADKYKQVFVAERRALGELDHPDSSVVNLQNVSHNVNVYNIDVMTNGEPYGFDLENDVLTYQGFDEEVELGNINREQEVADKLKTIF